MIWKTENNFIKILKILAWKIYWIDVQKIFCPKYFKINDNFFKENIILKYYILAFSSNSSS